MPGGAQAQPLFHRRIDIADSQGSHRCLKLRHASILYKMLALNSISDFLLMTNLSKCHCDGRPEWQLWAQTAEFARAAHHWRLGRCSAIDGDLRPSNVAALVGEQECHQL